MKILKKWFQRLNKSQMQNATLEVKIEYQADKVSVQCGEDRFELEVMTGESYDKELVDFVTWLCLPIAMARKANLFIHGVGSAQAKINAEKLSDIWSSWLPERYSMIQVDYSVIENALSSGEKKSSLFCFSGGVDSTYSLLNAGFSTKPDLLTVLGMDYNAAMTEQFSDLCTKTENFISNYSGKRIVVKTNAYEVYKKYGIGGQLSHVFLLFGVGLMFAKNYEGLYLAADHSDFQQFEVFPAGSLYPSNRWFFVDNFKLHVHGEDTTRAEKVGQLAKNNTALNAISFCKNRKIRPLNCGVCSKCMRTKYMFLASVGYIPCEVFIDNKTLSKNLKFSTDPALNRSYIQDAYRVAYRSGNLDKVSFINDYYHKYISRR
ncbi:MAG: hypothetical protein IBX48_09620 [Thiomicrospira sp.]|uniref:hypothetical protein n=1 Tax=Thiomicrospira sp. TaxID=935 RepID=UPI0019DBEE98|nr:hypothetical protein [Thiomicrospira sp.]MBE0494584.1 hypothetical protein [Thiomicrospira sp.]